MTYEIDLTKIEGEGDFPCPKCGVNISPEDETNKVYNILKVDSDGKNIKSITLQCQQCKSQIKLKGFQELEL